MYAYRVWFALPHFETPRSITVTAESATEAIEAVRDLGADDQIVVVGEPELLGELV
jgi:hypothetical protein